MKIKHLLAALAASATIETAFAQGTAFTYQGRLNSGGNPASGLFDFRFRLDADPLGNNILATVTSNAIPVTNGLFITPLDFGPGWFNGTNYWLEIDVRTNGAGGYDELFPLQVFTPTPYAVFAKRRPTSVAPLRRRRSAARWPTVICRPVPPCSGTVTAGAFSGNGAGVTNVNAAALNGLGAANFWQLGGNNVSGGQFLGSTNNQPLYLAVNGKIVQQLSYANDPIYGYAPNLIGGYSGNFASNGVVGGFIGGGGNALWPNILGGNYSAILGGNFNAANGTSAMAMGTWCTANGNSAIAAGYHNTVNGNYAVAMGIGNTVGGMASVALGWGNTTSLDGGVAIGINNAASGNDGFAIGANNEAGGIDSFALGNGAQSLHNGAFVWADDAQTGAFASTGNNQFLIRAGGGVGIGTNARRERWRWLRPAARPNCRWNNKIPTTPASGCMPSPTPSGTLPSKARSTSIRPFMAMS